MKAVVLIMEDLEEAQAIARLIAAALSLNGYQHNEPSVIDWPEPK